MKHIKKFESQQEEWKKSHAEWRKAVNELDELIDKKAGPYNGSYRFYDDTKPDRVLMVEKEIPGIGKFDLNYTYLYCFYTSENIPNRDEYTNEIIEGTYDVYNSEIYLNKEQFEKENPNPESGQKSQVEFISSVKNNINIATPTRVKTSYIFFKTPQLKQLINAIK